MRRRRHLDHRSVAEGRSLERWASASRCPSRSSLQKRARASARGLLSAGCSPLPSRRQYHLQQRAIARRRGFCILVHLNELRRPPAGVVAGGTGREHGLSAGAVADEPPRFAPDILIEWMRMPDLRRDGFAAVGADGAERLISFGSASAAASRHDERPDLFAPRGAEPGGAPARWMAPGIGSLPRGDRSGAGRERPSVG